jgi:DNA-directed RNA polymerase subunit RPC12/RpoP
VAWCEECEHLVEDEELDEGACPTCGTQLLTVPRRPVPWYFKGMIAASIVYLGYRSYQGITWLMHHA